MKFTLFPSHSFRDDSELCPWASPISRWSTDPKPSRLPTSSRRSCLPLHCPCPEYAALRAQSVLVPSLSHHHHGPSRHFSHLLSSLCLGASPRAFCSQLLLCDLLPSLGQGPCSSPAEVLMRSNVPNFPLNILLLPKQPFPPSVTSLFSCKSLGSASHIEGQARPEWSVYDKMEWA